MSTRRGLAMDIGGPYLLRAVIAMRPNRWRLKHLTLSKVIENRDDQVEDNWQMEVLPEVMTKDAATLTSDEQARIRDLFYSLTNMTVPALSQWARDPRIVDGTGKRPRDIMSTRLHLRELVNILSSTRHDGWGWTPRNYDSARRSIFVIQNLFSPRYVDYQVYVTLKNFGHDWTRAFGRSRKRRLPRLVQLEAQLAKVRLGNAGRH